MHSNLDWRNPLDSLVQWWKKPWQSLAMCSMQEILERNSGPPVCMHTKQTAGVCFLRQQPAHSNWESAQDCHIYSSGRKSPPPNLLSPELHHTLQLAGRALRFASSVFGSYCSAPSWKVSGSSCSAWPWPSFTASSLWCCRAGARELCPAQGVQPGGLCRALLYLGAGWTPSLGADFSNKTITVQIFPVKHSSSHKG